DRARAVPREGEGRMAARRRVALVASSFDPHTGGVESHVRRGARVLAWGGRRVEVWTVDRGEHLGTRRVDGVLVRYLPTPQPSTRPGDVARFALAAPAAGLAWARAYRAFRPDVLHVQCFGPNGAYALALRTLTRTPVVVSSHGGAFADDHAAFEHSRLLRSALERSVRVAGAVTGCSRVVADDLVRFGAADAVVVPNGVDLAGAPAPAPRTAAAHEPVVVAVGRIEHVKGFDLLVDAFATSALRDRARLVAVGDGSAAGALRRRVDAAGLTDRGEVRGRALRARALGAPGPRGRAGLVGVGDGGAAGALRRRVDAAGLTDRVELPGRLDPPEVAARLAAADVVVVPSRADAAPLVVL